MVNTRSSKGPKKGKRAGAAVPDDDEEEEEQRHRDMEVRPRCILSLP